MKQIKAHFDGKQIVLDEEVNLEPDTQVTILVEESNDQTKTNGGKTDPLEIFGKAVDTGIEDLAENHDHYLYGTPKRTHSR